VNARKLIKLILNYPLSIIFSLHYKKKITTHISNGVGFSDTHENLRNSLIIGYFQTYIWASLEKIKGELVNLELENPSDNLAKYQKLAEIEKPLVVHIRLGDYLNESSFGIPSEMYYQNALRELFDPNKHKKIWIFTNDQSGAENLFPKEYYSLIKGAESSLANWLEFPIVRRSKA
jgi:hypothetical protein